MNAADSGSGVDGLRFDNRFVRELRADPELDPMPRQVFGAHFSRVEPLRVQSPSLVAYSREMAELLGLDEAACLGPGFAEVFSGQRSLAGMDPFAMCYGGHQFGSWAGQLGDGRAINLGEVLLGEEHWTLQLKGAGPTPYSRSADGLAVMRSSVREFLCSEAMHHLGVPTTRALSLVSSGNRVLRDMFYDGHARFEPGAIVCRMSPSFVRFGNFQIHAARRENGALRELLQHVLGAHFAQLGTPSPDVYAAWFREVCQRTAKLIVAWMRVGFVHGVMNTDNMSVLGLTLDYGPYGWLEGYDPGWTPNTTDKAGRRYAFGNQAQVALWNLAQLAQALHPLIGSVEPLESALAEYRTDYARLWHEMMCAKLGLVGSDPAGDAALIEELLEILTLVETDMTIFFRRLGLLNPGAMSENEIPAVLLKSYYNQNQLTPEYQQRLANWLGKYRQRAARNEPSAVLRRERMQAVNPKYVLRNWLAQVAIDKAEEGDYAGVNELLEVLRKPYSEQPSREAYAARRPEWARDRAGCSMLSCSS